MIRVLSPGLFTTVQDLGRPGFCHQGVSAAGAADPISLRLANGLVGNRESAACLEMTLRGGRFVFSTDAWMSVCGGDFDCSIPMWRSILMRAGVELTIGACCCGARCYLAVRGGIRAKHYLGSASAHVLSGLGNVVQKDDWFELGDGAVSQVITGTVAPSRSAGRIRVTAGAETDRFPSLAVFSFLQQTWTVSADSNRQGVRLRGSAVASPGAGFMASEGMALGAIQIVPGGEPVILFVDSQTTGGYPVIANVAAVDLGCVGQLRPGAEVRFEPVSFETARRLLFEQEAWLRAELRS